MNVFEVVKENVTARQAAEAYGLKVGRTGMACCPFHSDKSPSMKLDERYYCFGCGATGDAVDLTAKLFGIGLREAAVKLAEDFGLNYDSRQKPSVRPRIREPTPEQKYQKGENHCYKVLTDYFHLLREWEKKYAPKQPDEEWNPLFAEALHRKNYIEYLLDILLYGSLEERKALVAEQRKEVLKLEQRIAELSADRTMHSRRNPKQLRAERERYETHPADRKRQCVFGGSSNTLDFLPLDRTGNRRFVPVMVYPERAEVHILADEQASREYINQMWAEAMEIYRSGNFRLRFSPAMNAYLKAHQKDFMPEDTKAGQILDYLERYSGSMVCSKQLYKEALGHDYDEPKQWELREINDIMNNAVTGWRAFSNPRYFPEPYRRQKGWERIRNDNEPDNSMDGFQEIPTEEMEQLGLPEEWLKQK